MAKTCIFIFSLLAVTHLLPESISRRELTALKQNCIQLYNEKKYPESISALTRYLSFRDEVQFKIYLAKSILFRKDLPEPEEKDEIFLRQEKIHNIVKNYKKSSTIFSEVISAMEHTTPLDKTIINPEKMNPKDKAIAQRRKEIAELYFLWAFSEYFGEDKKKSIELFKKSALINPEFKSMANYNIATLYEDLGQIRDSQIYFNK